jgi:hypothetical protein
VFYQDLPAAVFRRGRVWPAIASPRPLFFSLPTHYGAGLRQRGSPPHSVWGGLVNDLGRHFEVGSAGRLPELEADVRALFPELRI